MAACSAHKNTPQSRFWQSFTTRYNVYYNASQAYIDGALEKEKGNKDNFTEMLPLYTVGNKSSQGLGKGNFDRAIEKSEKAIKLRSIKAKPSWNKSRSKTDKDREWLGRREYNPFLWRAWLLMGLFDESAATFSYMWKIYQTQPAINGIARSWLARCYLELDWLYDAEDVVRNMSRDTMHYRAKRDWDYTYANHYIKNHEYEKAIPYLRKAISHERRKTQKARMWYIMAQMETSLGHNTLAYKAYQHAIRQNPPYELEFNARISQTEVMAEGNGKRMISKLKRMARDGNNQEYLDQVYYAIGNIYMMQKDTMKAITAYETGNEKSTRNGIEKGVLLLRLGDLYWDLEKYNDAQRCYGTAIGLLDKERPDYEELSKRSKVLDELVPYTDAIHLQDSLLELADMPEDKRLEAIDRVIAELKRKEKEERDKAREAEVEATLQKRGATGNRNQQQTPTVPTPNQQSGAWYFYNPLAVSQGKQTFERKWGRRENVDDWQRTNRTVVGSLDIIEPLDSIDNNPAANDQAVNDSIADNNDKEGQTDSVPDDPHKREYYLAQIPFTDEQKEVCHQIIKDGLLNSGIIFKDKLENLRLSEKQLLRLTGTYPDFEQNDLAWYHLFLLYSRLGNTEAANNCLAHLQADFPESEWTVLLSDPNYFSNVRFGEHIEDSLYTATYEAFKKSRYDEVKANTILSAERFPLGENRAKFIFIDGLSCLNDGDVKGCIAQLKTVLEKYPQSEVAEMAGMIIKGVQEGRTLYGGKFDLDEVWARRDLTLDLDSVSGDTLSADRNVNFAFLLVYQPDSLMAGNGRSPIDNENQLLYEMARYNFSNFLVRNFDLQIDREPGFSRMLVSGFLNFDEALQYARKLLSDEQMKTVLRACRSVVISEHNLSLIGTRYSFKDYDEFYERTFLPLQISDEELLQIPEAIEQEEEEEETEEGEENEDAEQPVQQPRNAFDFDDDFY